MGFSGAYFAGTLLSFYHSSLPGSPAPVYRDVNLSSLIPQPLVADANGQFGTIYLDASLVYGAVLYAQNSTTLIYQEDPVPESLGGGSNVANYLYPSLAIAQAAVIPGGTPWLELMGYTTPGDGGGGLYHPAAAGAGPGKFQSADGQWWILDVSRGMWIEQFGGKADCPAPTWAYTSPAYTATWPNPGGLTDNSAALLAAMQMGTGRPPGATNGTGPMLPIQFANQDSTHGYYFASTIVPPRSVWLKGNSGAGAEYAGIGTFFQFPPNTVGIRLYNGASTLTPFPGQTPGDSVFEGLQILGGGGNDRTAHGFWHTCPVKGKNIEVAQFAGDNYHNVGNGSAAHSDPTFGNTSGSYIENLTCLDAGNWNEFIQGSDVSASTFINERNYRSRLGGLFDGAPFANTHVGWQCNSHGNGTVGACQSGGRAYALRDPTPGIGSSTAPGSNNAIWYDMGALASPNSEYPAYNSGNTYEMSLPAYLTGLGTTLQGYNENFYLPVYAKGGAMVLNGTIQTTNDTPIVYADASVGAVLSNTSLGTLAKFSPDDPTVGANRTFSMGLNSSPGTIALHGRANERGGQYYQYDYTTGGHGIRYGLGGEGSGQPFVYFISTYDTDETFGRVDPLRFAFQPLWLIMNDRTGNYGRGRLLSSTVAAPTGEAAQGEVSFKQAPADGGIAGWICTVGSATTPTWSPFGIVGAIQGVAQANSTAAVLADLVTDFNALLAKLRTAKLIAT